MKLRRKISLIVVLLVTLAVTICGGITLASSAASNIRLAISYGESNHAVRSASWYDAVQSVGKKGDRGTTQRSVARYYVQLFCDDGTILCSGTDTIYNSQHLDPSEYVTPEEEQQISAVVKLDGSSILIVGQRYVIKDMEFDFYEVSDITSVYKNIGIMAIQFVLIDLAVIALTVVLSILLVRRALKPLETLKAGTTQIANGVYNQRVEIQGQDEVGELAQDFNQMAEAVEQHVQELKEEAQRQTLLLSALTHELKTPLTGIKGNAETLLMTQITEEEQQNALQYIDEECTRVERLSQKLMQLIALRKNGELTLQSCKVSDLLEQVRISSGEQLRQKRLKLVIENNMDTVQAEPDLLVSLLLNLVDNADKASRAGDVILLSACDNCISVRDFGRGIPKNELDKITQPFYMVDKSRARRAGGIGLGLALAREIAELHHAALEFESEVGEGTTVRVQFSDVRCFP